MPLPFRNLTPPEIVDVAGFQVPKKGCLTVAEEAAIRDLHGVIEKEFEGLTQLQADIKLKQRVVTILFQSRLDSSWTLEKTCSDRWEVEAGGDRVLIEPDMQMLDALYEFTLNEQKRWGALQADEVNTKKKESTGPEPGSGSATSSPPSKNSKRADLVTAP
jgi:hypothetical protein